MLSFIMIRASIPLLPIYIIVIIVEFVMKSLSVSKIKNAFNLSESVEG